MSLDKTHPTARLLAGQVRREYGRITAYRFGLIAGLNDRRDLAPPYPDMVGREAFREGVNAGLRMRARRQELLAEEENANPIV